MYCILMTRIPVIALVACIVASYGCEETPLAPVWENVLIEGQITEVGRDVGQHDQLAILVETDPGSPPNPSEPGEDKVIFYLTRYTSVESDDSAVDLSIHDLAVGLHVRVWPRGIMITTYPGQADAGRVQVVLN